MSDKTSFDISQEFEQLQNCQQPLLIGVRHHSAAMARALPAMLDGFKPQSVLVEMPSDFADWIQYLADEQTVAPVAISAADARGNLVFYPLADFSPELVAIRWAAKNDVPVVPIDLSAGTRIPDEKLPTICQAIEAWKKSSSLVDDVEDTNNGRLLNDLMRKTQSEDSGQLWERLIETPGILADAESIRLAGLYFGWAVRKSTCDIAIRDLVRESVMRLAIRNAPARSVAVVGAFHSSALLPSVLEAAEEYDRTILGLLDTQSQTVGVALIGYSFEQLDERSGYPAGIRDPVWHDKVISAKSPEEMASDTTQIVVDVCRELRKRGHVAGTPDATEIVRMMRDLARLRSLPIAGRGELIESIQSCLVQGELHGRAREVASALETVLIGNRKGSVTEKVPRCGLAQSIEEQIVALKLPKYETKELKLDVMRDARDRARAVVLRQLCAANIPYAKRLDTVEQGNRENLIEHWEVGFKQGTNATIESVSRYGVTLVQAVEGIVLLRTPREDSEEFTPKILAERLAIASECGLHKLTRETISQISGRFIQAATINDLVEVATRIERIAVGHVPGLPLADQLEYPPYLYKFECEALSEQLVLLVQTSLDRLSGLKGSNEDSDVAGLCELGHWLQGSSYMLAQHVLDQTHIKVLHQSLPQLISWCEQTLVQGSDRMRGAAIGMLCVLNQRESKDFAPLLYSWVDDAIDQLTRKRLTESLAGAAQVLLPMMQTDVEWLSGLNDCLLSMTDDAFLKRLPALRGAFHVFSPADRRRLLDVQLEAIQERGSELSLGQLADQSEEDVASQLALLRQADLDGLHAVTALFPDILVSDDRLSEVQSVVLKSPGNQQTHVESGSISHADRWRLVMGVPTESNAMAHHAAKSLDQLYGVGRGEGARSHLSRRGAGGGTEKPAPTVAEWSEDLESLFGSDVCQEVLGVSAANGNLAAVTVIDPESVVPSVGLLQQVLSLAGGTAESKTTRLRQIAKRITEQLAMKLAVRLRPHVHGLSTSRPTRRRNRRLNLARTIRGNLANAMRRDDGRATIIAKNLIFNSLAKREMDWHLTFVVDVSGSMTESVVYSALCAAIFSELPALSIRFLAFSTQVIDLSEHVPDPLSLLLEVQVGGGTNIGLGLRHARSGLRVPTRSMVILVTDFEEGVSPGQMIAEARALIESGAKCLGLAALNDKGQARYHQGCAQMMASAGMPVAALAPEKLAQWVGDQVRGG